MVQLPERVNDILSLHFAHTLKTYVCVSSRDGQYRSMGLFSRLGYLFGYSLISCVVFGAVLVRMGGDPSKELVR